MRKSHRLGLRLTISLCALLAAGTSFTGHSQPDPELPLSHTSGSSRLTEPSSTELPSQPVGRSAAAEKRFNNIRVVKSENNSDEMNESLGQRYFDAELVAQVLISGIHRDIDNALSEPGMVAVRGYVYSAVSQQVWKGEGNRLIAFRLGLDACEQKLKRGAKYLIFAHTDSSGRLQLLGCDSFVPEGEAAPLLARLNLIHPQG